jgi:hypothetical protein
MSADILIISVLNNMVYILHHSSKCLKKYSKDWIAFVQGLLARRSRKKKEVQTTDSLNGNGASP